MILHDVLVIGGSFAGITAALQLGRARRDVVVLDAGERRNRFAAHAHGVLGMDGLPPGEIVARGRADLARYPTVAWREGRAAAARAVPGGFAVRLGDGDGGDEIIARRLILAGGVIDDLPPLPGLAERWGRSVFHCPYCHGYELDRGRLGVLGRDPMALHSAALVAEWTVPGGATLFVDGAGFRPDGEQRAELDRRGVALEPTPVVGLEGDGPGLDLRLADGRAVHLAGLFIVSRTRVALAPLATALGCAFEDGPLGAYLKVDMTRQTSVPGVFAAGDATTMAGSINLALADGAMAGVGAHRSLVFPDA